MNGSRALAAAGVVALAVALAVLASPGLLAVSLDRLAVTAVGVLALLVAVGVARRRLHHEYRQAATPDPELPADVPPPGADLDDVLAQFDDSRPVYYFGSSLRRGLDAAAVAVLVRYHNLSVEEARERLADGTWTDDPYAAAFLGDDLPPPPLGVRLRSLLTPGSTYQRRVARTVDAVVEVAGLNPRETDRRAADSGFASRLRRRASAGVAALAPSRPADADAANRSSGPLSTGHWDGIRLVALVGVAVGVLTQRPAVVLAGVVGVGYAAYARSTALPPVDLSVERDVDDERPDPGASVEVTVRVTNEGDRTLPDVRLVDGVPEALSVVEGSPRRGTALRAGETVTVRYAVAARRGVHEFGPLLAVARNLSSTAEDAVRVAAPSTITCAPALRPTAAPIPLRERHTPAAGRVETSSGGEGVEFFATRAYRPGDPMRRVDWNRRARTGELATLEFREERAATVVLVVDVRAAAYVAPDPDGDHAVDRSVEAAGRVFAALGDAGDRVGVAAFDGDCWLPPGAGPAHRARARDLLGTHPSFRPVPRERQSHPRRWLADLRRRLPGDAQVVLFSPLVDAEAARAARHLDAAGVPVTVVSPDPTVADAPSRRLARVARAVRISDLRGAGIPVVDWPWTDSLDVTIERFRERRSR
ncbi:MAG: DUF58 domain-containing protein [Salinigranum sp.]